MICSFMHGKKSIVLAALAGAMVLCGLIAGCSELEPPQQQSTVMPSPVSPLSGDGIAEEGEHLRLSLSDEGYDIFSPSPLMTYDYSYGPSIVLEEDGSMDAYFSSPADGVMEFDWISHRHSDDGGATWSSERVVLSPSPGSMDALSVCDPDVFFYDGYYYMGYTSTIDATLNGLCNNVFLARSKEPYGPFEKWNGSSWGGDPAPIIYYDGFSIGWGCGEPSFVVMDDTLYVYSTRDSYSPAGIRTKSTQVRCADMKDPSWPASLEYKGVAALRTDNGEGASYVFSDCDSMDMAYAEEFDRFVAVCTNRRFTDSSTILYFDSSDGITFELVSELNTNVICGCHNCGIMSDGSGHIKKGDPMLLGYGYAGWDNSAWGNWATRFAPLEIKLGRGSVDRSDENKDNIKQTISYGPGAGDDMQMLQTGQVMYSTTLGRSFNIEYFLLDQDHNRHPLGAGDISFSGYDPAVIEVRDGIVRARAAGFTRATIEYRGLRRQIGLCCYDDSVSMDVSPGLIQDMFSVEDEYTLSLEPADAVVIRPVIRTQDYVLMEPDNEQIKSLGITFRSSNKKICKVGEDGGLIPAGAGSCRIRVSAPDGRNYEVKVTVTDTDG